MSAAVCIVDTSVLVELLGVPDRSTNPEEYKRELRRKTESGETLLLPLATVIETGNHIGQIKSGLKNGAVRRSIADRFCTLVRRALDGDSPFKPTPLPTQDTLRPLLDEFPNWATQGSGLGDLTIKQVWEQSCALNRGRRVYVWSLDAHLAGLDRPPVA